MVLLKKIEHTLLKPYASKNDIQNLCDEAKEYGFGAVCVNGNYVKAAVSRLKGSDVGIVAVTGFPLGTNVSKVKAYEAKIAVDDGAHEIDMVMHIGALKDRDYETVLSDIESVIESVHDKAIVKVILETCLLTDEEIVTACHICEKAGAAFVKTSTGFNGPGAIFHHVKLMKETVGDRLRVKAAGGIKTLEQAYAMIEAGADRLGCSSSVLIAQTYLKDRI